MYKSTFYFGVPSCGKTTAALRDAINASKQTGSPIVVVDPARVANFAKWYHCTDMADLCNRVWNKGEHVAVTFSEWKSLGRAHNEIAFDMLCRAVAAGKNVELIIDECHRFMDARSIPEEFVNLTTALRHARSNVYCTTQHFANIPSICVSNAPTLKLFRTENPRTLERLEREFGIDVSALATLPAHSFIEHTSGFSS